MSRVTPHDISVHSHHGCAPAAMCGYTVKSNDREGSEELGMDEQALSLGQLCILHLTSVDPLPAALLVVLAGDGFDSRCWAAGLAPRLRT